jgi:hypothetical protein
LFGRFYVTAFSASLDTEGIVATTGQMFRVKAPTSPEVVAIPEAFA